MFTPMPQARRFQLTIRDAARWGQSIALTRQLRRARALLPGPLEELSVAIVGEDTDFGRGGAAAFASVARKNGLEVISTDFHPQNYPDFTSLLTRIQQSKPDAIAIFQLAGDQLNFLRNAMQLGVRIPYIGRFDPGGNNLQIIQAGGMEGSITAWTYSYLVDTPSNKAFAAWAFSAQAAGSSLVRL